MIYYIKKSNVFWLICPSMHQNRPFCNTDIPKGHKSLNMFTKCHLCYLYYDKWQNFSYSKYVHIKMFYMSQEKNNTHNDMRMTSDKHNSYTHTTMMMITNSNHDFFYQDYATRRPYSLSARLSTYQFTVWIYSSISCADQSTVNWCQMQNCKNLPVVIWYAGHVLTKSALPFTMRCPKLDLWTLSTPGRRRPQDHPLKPFSQPRSGQQCDRNEIIPITLPLRPTVRDSRATGFHYSLQRVVKSREMVGEEVAL